MIKKGRAKKAKGELHGGAKLCEEEVVFIIEHNDECDVKSLAKKFGVSVKTIKDIISKKSWKHLHEL